MKEFFGKLEEGFKKIHNTISPLGGYVLCLLPFWFLYLNARECILIKEEVIVPVFVAMTALMTVTNPGVGFLPCGAVVFLCLWQKNFYIAVAAAVLFLFAAFQTGDKKKGRFIFALLVIIFCAGKYNSLMVLMICFMLASTIYWNGKSDNILIIPLAVMLNQLLFATGSEIDAVEQFAQIEEKPPILSYFQTVYANMDLSSHMATLIETLKGNPLFYAIFLGILVFGAGFCATVSRKTSRSGELVFVFVSQLLAGLAFAAAHFAAHMSIGKVLSITAYLPLLLKSLLISMLASLFVDLIFVSVVQEIGGKSVFISYSHKDIDTAKSLCRQLENNGIGCWYAPRDIPAGKEWASAIMEAINEVDAVALIFTDHSNDSVQVKSEVDAAISRGIPVIPLKYTYSNPSGGLSYYLSTLQWLDARRKSIDVVTAELIRMIRKPEEK
ncbi:MAG: toll/interleukin-1 receptor domain-containing protein [Erysipelotrichaceae bacterium]|nr:toll/interleukin-1 receptor domain-containing protein [Erysipelotrichaceae bacterium]